MTSQLKILGICSATISLTLFCPELCHGQTRDVVTPKQDVVTPKQDVVTPADSTNPITLWQKPANIIRLPKVLLTESWHRVRRSLLRSNENPQVDESDPDEVFQKASQQISELATLSQTRKLTSADLAPTWNLVYHLHSMKNVNNYDRTLRLYEKLHELPLPVMDQLETTRYVGQHQYRSLNYNRAIQIFSEADGLAKTGLSADEKESFARTMGNILYLKGLALKKQGKSTEVVANYRRMMDDPAIMANIPAITQVSIYYKTGIQLHTAKEFGKARETFDAGIKVLDKNKGKATDWDPEKDYRISMEIGRVKSATLAENPDQPDYQQLLEDLDKLKDKFEGKGYPDFHSILRTRVVIANEVDDKKQYVKLIEELRDYFMKKYETVKDWGDDEPYFLQSSELLIDHHLKEKSYEKAGEVLAETKELADPPEQWFYQFPKTFRDKALAKSVLDQPARDRSPKRDR